MNLHTGCARIERLCLTDFCKPGEESHYHLAVVSDRSTVHTHDFYEIELVTEGRLWIETNGEARVVPEGHVILTRPDDCHRLGSADRTPCRFINLAFSPAVMQDRFRIACIPPLSGCHANRMAAGSPADLVCQQPGAQRRSHPGACARCRIRQPEPLLPSVRAAIRLRTRRLPEPTSFAGGMKCDAPHDTR